MDDPDDTTPVVRELLTGSILDRKAGDIFFFGHRSFAEFLVARLYCVAHEAGNIAAGLLDFGAEREIDSHGKIFLWFATASVHQARFGSGHPGQAHCPILPVQRYDHAH